MAQNFQRIFSNFQRIFQFSLYMQKLSPTRGLEKDKIYSFFEIFQAPQKIFIPTTILKSSEWAENIINNY